jgi:hypothetical protein
MTALEHIYAVQNIINKGRKSDDAPFTNQLILHYLNTARLLLLKREADKNRFLNPANFQGFCMKLIVDSWNNCCDLPEDLNCPILRTCNKIPKAITGRTNIYVKVSYMSGNEIGRTTHRSYHWNKYSLTKIGKPQWFILNDYLYIIGVPYNILNAVWVDGLFEDPIKAANVAVCSEAEEPCDPLEAEYPIEGFLIEPMYDMVLQRLGLSMKYPQDDVNNAKNTEISNDKEE